MIELDFTQLGETWLMGFFFSTMGKTGIESGSFASGQVVFDCHMDRSLQKDWARINSECSKM